MEHEYDLWHQANLYYFKDKFGSMHTVLEIKDDFTLKVQCVSERNRGAVFCIAPQSVVLKPAIIGDIRISRKKHLQVDSKTKWRD